MEQTNLESLSRIQIELLKKARQVTNESYSPYSNFCVGAALLTEDDNIIVGTNVENAAFGSCMCAERSAIYSAHSLGYKKFKAIAIIARFKDEDTKTVTAPCGSCRQVIFEISEISGVNMEVIMANTDGSKVVLSTINELLPMAFGPNDLKK